MKEITIQEQAPLHIFSLLAGKQKRIVEVAFEIKGLIFPLHQEHQPRRSLLFIKLSMLFIILNVAAFSWVVLSNLQSSPSNC